MNFEENRKNKDINETAQRVVLMEDENLIVANKPGGLPTVADQTGDLSLHQILEEYAEKTLFPVHRLDRPVSGAVIYAKNAGAVTALNAQFKAGIVHRIYLAAVATKPKENEATLNGWIKSKSKPNRSHFSLQKMKGSKRAMGQYAVAGEIDRYFLLAFKLSTGRHHQIRAMLQHLQCPARGDVKYGARRKNKDRSIHLHAYYLGFNATGTLEADYRIFSPLPDDPVWNAFEIDNLEDFLTKKGMI